jgi:hypothetical protein
MNEATSRLLSQLSQQEIYFQSNNLSLSSQLISDILSTSPSGETGDSLQLLSHTPQRRPPSAGTGTGTRGTGTEVILDGRILGDYSEWSFISSSNSHSLSRSTSGSRHSLPSSGPSSSQLDEILDGYHGLQPPLVGDRDTTFTKSGSYLCSHLLEVIIRPDVLTKDIMASLQKVAATERLR